MDDLTRALIHQDFESLPVEMWQKSNLAAYVFCHTSAAYRRGLLPHYAHALQRWKAQEKELRELLLAWNAAGIVPLLIKGVAMALKHYTHPGERYFGDIDLMLDRSQMARARDLAAGLGWQVLFDAQRDRGFSVHESLGLISPSHNIKLDVHHALLKHPKPFERRALDMQRLLEPCMEHFDWEGVQVRMLGLADTAIVPLMLHRAWYRDRWNLKRFDYLDLNLLREAGLTREALLERAKVLGCQTTVELFLQRCDPWQKVLDLKPLDATKLDLWRRQISPERGYSEHQGQQARTGLILGYTPYLVRNVLRGTGWVLKAALVLQKQQTLQELCNHVVLRRTSQPDFSQIHKARVGVLGASKLLAYFPRGNSGMCVLRALAALWWLRSAGVDAELVSGVRNDGGKIKGHAWIEYQGSVLAIIAADLMAPLYYKINFRSSIQQNSRQSPDAASGQGPSAAD
ncbi:lasso peptide biosynthesis B2 protein [Deinococcus cellulosilyticus]|uniref:Microcin J25-processing protein McjB C-terminal domain-containing protein n=1 Tax=Deinococcus cellulosilyticus (strain DSM 18568 / NBRC 106333 / KACC 11606 / 5516J-15) TaxID=1223518 RepID=A0A511MX73_DEIC1|nr:lasso peptide biosynthesis B2 protein [Deinococcus cellulosilyticus]GEM44747.1 hypothetical protein DC3_03820 [Deinococcus cellulosilyticus NBRC 106333 = KACC 11606]